MAAYQVAYRCVVFCPPEVFEVTLVEKKMWMRSIVQKSYVRISFVKPSFGTCIEEKAGTGRRNLLKRPAAYPNKPDIWMGSGWTRSDMPYTWDTHEAAHGYNIERRILDPLLKKVVMALHGIRFLTGVSLEAVSLFT